jgi:hypothetical protein
LRRFIAKTFRHSFNISSPCGVTSPLTGLRLCPD